ncbi:hypothetical protein [Bacteroides caccae]|uniref:hypothetical protein n=1 Tax=Bacteroides caccae TaxID=47678 RepID=UPI001F00C18C
MIPLLEAEELLGAAVTVKLPSPWPEKVSGTAQDALEATFHAPSETTSTRTLPAPSLPRESCSGEIWKIVTAFREDSKYSSGRAFFPIFHGEESSSPKEKPSPFHTFPEPATDAEAPFLLLAP